MASKPHRERTTTMYRGGAARRGFWTVFALDSSTGTPMWQQPVNTTFNYGVPAVADGRVYVAGRRAEPAEGGGLSTAGDLYAFDAATGDPCWHIPTASWVEASPAVGAGHVYLVTRGSSINAATMSVFDSDSSALRWERQINHRANSASLLPADGVRSSPTIADGVLYVGNPNGTLYAHRADTGEGTTPSAAPLADRIAYKLLRRLFGYKRPKE